MRKWTWVNVKLPAAVADELDAICRMRKLDKNVVITEAIAAELRTYWVKKEKQ